MKKTIIIFIGFIAEMVCFIFAGAFLIVNELIFYWMMAILGVIIAGTVGDIIAKNAVENYKRFE